MKAYLSRRYHFSASHRLHAESLSADANRAAFGKCNNPHGHGHNYMVEVTFSGQIDPVTGMLVNLTDLDAFARQHLLNRFDVANLNTLDSFQHLVPTTENLSIEIYNIFIQFSAVKLEHVHVEETSNNAFDFAGTSLPRPGSY